MKVHAQAHSDDRAVEAHFDAAPFFEHATREEVLDLARCNWSCDYAADLVALRLSDVDPGLERLFIYLEFHPVGFEVYVDEDDAVAWLHEHRRDVWEGL